MKYTLNISLTERLSSGFCPCQPSAGPHTRSINQHYGKTAVDEDWAYWELQWGIA